MHSVQVSDRIKAIIDRHVASGEAPDPSTFVENAVLRHVEDIKGTAWLLEQAEHGLADIEAGRFVTIATKAEARAYWDRISLGIQDAKDAIDV